MTFINLMFQKITMFKHVKINQPQLPTFSLARSAVAFSTQLMLFGVMSLSPFLLPAAAAQNQPLTTNSASGAPEITPTPARMANFGQEASSPESRKLADWIVDSANNGRSPFIIVDKVNARVFVFDAQGQIRGTAPVLLGLAVGDDSVPGIGQRKLSSIRPEEKTTPAGRFVASLDRDIHGKEILWIDYDTSFSLHAVVKGTPKERRAERLASPSPLDRRISFGCINVPAMFYQKVVSPIFTGTEGIVYVLPETRSAKDVFGSYDVPARAISSAAR
jgi:hypothetical protein